MKLDELTLVNQAVAQLTSARDSVVQYKQHLQRLTYFSDGKLELTSLERVLGKAPVVSIIKQCGARVADNKVYGISSSVIWVILKKVLEQAAEAPKFSASGGGLKGRSKGNKF